MSATSEATAPDEMAADRIEQALERIAVLAARAEHAAVATALDATLAPRLDAVIERLRQALGN